MSPLGVKKNREPRLIWRLLRRAERQGRREHARLYRRSLERMGVAGTERDTRCSDGAVPD